MALTHYDVLSVPRRASMREIKASFRLRSHMFHPDKYETYDEPLRGQLKAEAAKEFKRLRTAYEVLGDSAKRSAYDRTLRGRTAGRSARRQTAPRPSAAAPAAGPDAAPKRQRAAPGATSTSTQARDPQLVVSPDHLDFGIVQPGTRRHLALRVTNAGGRTLFGEVVSNRAWLTVNRQSFISSSILVLVTLDTTHLLPGNDYRGTVLVSTLNGGDRAVDVLARVTGPPQPRVAGLPETLDFGAAEPGQLKSRTIRLTNTGTGRLTGSIAVTGSWLSVSQRRFDDDATFELIANARGLPAGSHAGELHVYSNGGSPAMAVSLLVREPDTSPPTGPNGTQPTDVTSDVASEAPSGTGLAG